MYAALKTAGTQPVVSELLNSTVKKGAKTSMTDLSVGIGSGSKAQLFSGSTWTAATTSSMETGSKQVKWTSGDDVVKEAAKHHQLMIENRRPWRQSNRGTVGRRCCHRIGHHRGPRVHRLNATVDVEKIFRR